MPFGLPAKRFIQTTERIELPAARFGPVQWVLSRALCRFKSFDLAQVPPKSRAQALQLELEQWSPFPASGFFIGWTGARALVWAWNATKVDAAIAAKGQRRKAVTVLPETVLRPPLDEGVRLERCHNGFDGQVWRGRLLERSRWWPELPGVEEWLSFQRDAGVAPEAQLHEVPAVHESVLGQPWIRPGAAQASAAQLEAPLAALVLVCLLAPAMWYAMNLHVLQQDTARLQAMRAELERDARPLLEARSQALDAQARAATLMGLAPGSEQLALMARLAEILPRAGLTLQEWEYSGSRLRIVVSSPAEIPATPVIGALQQTQLFSDVKAMAVANDPKSVVFLMELAPPARAKNEAASR